MVGGGEHEHATVRLFSRSSSPPWTSTHFHICMPTALSLDVTISQFLLRAVTHTWVIVEACHARKVSSIGTRIIIIKKLSGGHKINMLI